MTQKAAAAALCVAPATAHRWWHRRLAASEEELRSGSWLFDRPSRPRRSPRLLAAELQERICECRRHTGWGPRLVAGATRQAHSTVWTVLPVTGSLARRGRPGSPPTATSGRAPATCCTWTWPATGALSGRATRLRTSLLAHSAQLLRSSGCEQAHSVIPARATGRTEQSGPSLLHRCRFATMRRRLPLADLACATRTLRQLARGLRSGAASRPERAPARPQKIAGELNVRQARITLPIAWTR